MPHIFPILITSFVTVAGQLLLKRGVSDLGTLSFSFNELFALIPRALLNVWIIGGMVLFGMSFFLWILLLSKMSLSIAYPTLISVNFFLITIGSWFIFREQTSFFQIAGLVTIIMGIYLLSPKV
jgi:multidrug transporter EmrE-like cation transporter